MSKNNKPEKNTENTSAESFEWPEFKWSNETPQDREEKELIRLFRGAQEALARHNFLMSIAKEINDTIKEQYQQQKGTSKTARSFRRARYEATIAKSYDSDFTDYDPNRLMTESAIETQEYDMCYRDTDAGLMLEASQERYLKLQKRYEECLAKVRQIHQTEHEASAELEIEAGVAGASLPGYRPLSEINLIMELERKHSPEISQHSSDILKKHF